MVDRILLFAGDCDSDGPLDRFQERLQDPVSVVHGEHMVSGISATLDSVRGVA